MALANSRAQLASRRTAVKAHASAVKKPRSAIADVKRVLAAAIVAGSALASQVTPARAEDAVDAATSTAIEAVKATGAAAKTAIDLLGVGVKAVQQGYEAAAPVIKQGVDVVAPVVSSAVRVTADTAVPAIKAATPVVTNTVTSALKATGLDVEAAANTTGSVAKTAASSALPALTGAAAWLASKDPVTLGEYGLGAAALYFLAPALLGGLAGGLRGFAGELTATQALDAINNDSTAILIDVRTSAEKERGGLPDVAGNARDRSIEVEFAVTDDRRLRGQLRDPSAIEAQITALQIASLKRIGKGSRIVLLDKNGGQAKAVAKELSRRGFGKVFVVGGGFEGRGGWVQSKLLVKPAAGSFTSSSPLQNIARTISTRTVSSGGRKQLPAPSK